MKGVHKMYNVSINRITASDVNNITVSHHGELMNNFFAESIIDTAKGLKAIKINEDDSLVFFIDKSDELCAVLSHHDTHTDTDRYHIKKDDPHSGWLFFKLSPNGMKVDAFDGFLDDNNKLRICYSGKSNGTTKLMISNSLIATTPNLNVLDTKLSWSPITLNDTNKTIDHIKMYENDLLYSTSFTGSDAEYNYYSISDQRSSNFQIPENCETMVQLELGKRFGLTGVYMIYKETDHTFSDLEFQGLGGALHRHDTVPANGQIEGFSLITDEGQRNSIRFICGSEIGYFDDRGYHVIVPKKDGVTYKKMDVFKHGDEISIWVLTDSGELQFITNRYYKFNPANLTLSIDLNLWTTPITMHKGIDDFSCIKGNNLINQLFLVGNVDPNTKGLIHFWQDSVSTLWEEHAVNITQLSKVHQKNTYTMTVDFTCSGTLKHFVGEKVRVGAEANVLVYLNNKKVHLGPNTDVDVTLDGNQLHVVYPTNSISSTKILIKGLYLPNSKTDSSIHFHLLVFKLDPANKFKERLKAKIPQGQDLTKLKNDYDGKPFINKHHDPTVLQQISNVTYHLAKSADSLETASTQTLTYRPTHVPSQNRTSHQGISLGSIWHAIKKGFDAVTSFVTKIADGVAHFVIEIGGAVFNWIAKTAEDVYSFVEQVWHSIEIGLKDFIKFIGFLFNWGDILDTKVVLKEYVLSFFHSMKQNLATFETHLLADIQALKDKVDQQKQSLVPHVSGFPKYAQSDAKAKKGKKDPRKHWVESKKSHVANGQITGQPQLSGPISHHTVQNFGKLYTHLQTLQSDMTSDFSDIGDKLAGFITGSSNMSIGDVIKYIILSLEGAALDLVKDIVQILFDIAEEIIQDIPAILKVTVDIPFFSALYKLINSGQELTSLDFMCLILAIPTTIVYKLIEGHAPFPQNDATNKNHLIGSLQSVFQLSN